jgi:hypothetical protein
VLRVLGLATKSSGRKANVSVDGAATAAAKLAALVNGVSAACAGPHSHSGSPPRRR